MRSTGLLLLATLAAVGGLTLVVTAWRLPRPSLATTARRLHRPAAEDGPGLDAASVTMAIGSMVASGPLAPRVQNWRAATNLVGRPLELHLGMLVVASAVGFVSPSLLVGVASLGGVDTGSIAVPAALSLLLATLFPLLLHSGTMSEANEIRLDLRHQLSAFFDMVTMLLAGNTGHEGALAQAADTGDGRLFRDLRRRMREAGARGRSHIHALDAVADDYDLEELRQFASAARLTAAEGAPVARTLAAKCATLRSTMAAEQEARARVRNDKITPPLVGMALLFMVLIIYPALQLN